jgi:hypothetical protein
MFALLDSFPHFTIEGRPNWTSFGDRGSVCWPSCPPNNPGISLQITTKFGVNVIPLKATPLFTTSVLSVRLPILGLH